MGCTSISSSNSSNTPTPTRTYHGSIKSLFDIASVAFKIDPYIPSIGPINSSKSSSSTSSSMDNTASPVTKMDEVNYKKEQKLFEDVDTVSIDYLTGDNKVRILKKQKHSKTKCKIISNKQYVHQHSNDEKRQKKRIKKMRDLNAFYNDTQSDSELNKGKKIRDKIKKISIRVPGDPNILYKNWKKSKLCSLKKVKSSPQIHKMQANEQNISNNKLAFSQNVKMRNRINSYPPNSYFYPYSLSSSSPPSSTNNFVIFPTLKRSQSLDSDVPEKKETRFRMNSYPQSKHSKKRKKQINLDEILKSNIVIERISNNDDSKQSECTLHGVNEFAAKKEKRIKKQIIVVVKEILLSQYMRNLYRFINGMKMRMTVKMRINFLCYPFNLETNQRIKVKIKTASNINTKKQHQNLILLESL